MTLTTAAEAMVRELRDIAEWETELSRDLTVTRARRRELLASLDALARILPIGDRLGLRIAVGQIEMANKPRPRRRSNKTRRVDLTHDYLAMAEDTVTTSGLQNWLSEGGQNPKKGLASIILSRKVDQGVVERLSRGLYRVNPHHPEIVARRRR